MLPQNLSSLPIFPIQILGLIIVRRLLDLIFSQHDLAWIDNILPEKEKQEADKKKKRRKGVLENADEEVGMVSGLGRRQRLGDFPLLPGRGVTLWEACSSTWHRRNVVCAGLGC